LRAALAVSNASSADEAKALAIEILGV
jgi:hypothetical protein